MKCARLASILVPALVATGCQGGDTPAPEEVVPAAEAAAASPPIAVVEERWITEADTLWDVDTPDLWTNGTEALVLVTGKGSHDLKVFDGATGETRPAIGQMGSSLGDFLRPNGVLVVEEFALVVERDNRRVQVLAMPEATPLGWFGDDVLEYPYGLAAFGEPGRLELWVTDDYEYEEDVLPDDLTHRLHRFSLVLHKNRAPEVVAHEAFGEASGAGSLRVVESIQTDPGSDRLFVADESRKSYLEYDRAGSYLGRRLAEGFIDGDPEGIVLVQCSEGGGYWVVTDQQDHVSLFRVFDRESLEFEGTFRGAVTANTDGATFEHGPVPGFPHGVLYAVHDDQALSAIDWRDVSTAMGLRSGCGFEE